MFFSLHFITSQADAKSGTTSINKTDGNQQFQNQSITEVPELSVIYFSTWKSSFSPLRLTYFICKMEPKITFMHQYQFLWNS